MVLEPLPITPGAKIIAPKLPTVGLGATVGNSGGDGRGVTIGVANGRVFVGKARVAVAVSSERVRVACNARRLER